MLMLIIDADRNRTALYSAHQFIVARIGTQGLADLDLDNPLDTDTDVLPALRECRDAIDAFYADREGNIALDAVTKQLDAAIADEEQHRSELEQEYRYLLGLHDSWSRHCESYPR